MCRTPRKSTEITTESIVVSSVKDRTDIKPLIYWPRRFALTLIRFYQTAISSRTPPSCFFYPTCSHYTYQAIECFGLWRGAWLGLCRILRCHPFTQGGYDPVPEKFLWFPTRMRREKANAESAQEGLQFEESHEGSHKDLDE